MDNKKKKKNDHQESRFLEAPFVRMLRMRSASLKIQKQIIGGNLYMANIV